MESLGLLVGSALFGLIALAEMAEAPIYIVHLSCADALDRAREAGVHVYMTVQTLWGYVQMYVYETGREIMGLGVVPAANMLPEVAYVKLGWALGQTHDRDEVERITELDPLTGELLAERKETNVYPATHFVTPADKLMAAIVGIFAIRRNAATWRLRRRHVARRWSCTT